MPLNTASLTLMALRMSPDAHVITLGSSSTFGLLNDEQQMGEDGSGEDLIVHTREVFIAAGTLTGVVDGATVTLRRVAPASSPTVSYTVRGRPMPRENGDIWAVRVTKVPT